MYATGYAPAHVRTDNAQGAPTLYDVHSDHLSTPKVVSGPTGSMAWCGEYAAFGEVVVDPASGIEFNVRYPGQYFDGETGLSYNRYRSYGASDGPYLSVDPLKRSVAMVYGYVVNNPLQRVDVLGLKEGSPSNLAKRLAVSEFAQGSEGSRDGLLNNDPTSCPRSGSPQGGDDLSGEFLGTLGSLNRR